MADFFKDLEEIVSDKFKVVEEKTGEFVAVQKLNAKKNSLTRAIKEKYREIGETVYMNHEKEEISDEEVSKLCKAIDDLKVEIEDCEKEIQKFKK